MLWAENEGLSGSYNPKWFTGTLNREVNSATAHTFRAGRQGSVLGISN